jgi:hemolysin activation/secretion protein
MVREAPSFNVNFSFDNYSPPSLGSERGGIVLGFRNWSGFGDQIAASFNRSTTGGNNQLDITYRAPLNARDGTLQARIAPNWTEITAESFDVLKIRGESELYELSYRQPLVRTTQKELGLSAGFTFQEGRTFIFNDLAVPFGIGPDQDGISRTSVIRVGIDYLRRDPLGSWALRSVQSFGTGLFNATTNEAPVPDGHFFSWQGQAQRAQQLAENHLLILRGDLQLTPHSLLPSQQFVIGGGQLVRGYRQNVRSGDNGLRFSIEDRITVKRDRQGNPILQVSPFIDLGTVWNVDGNPNVLPDRNGVMGTGIGILAPDILSGLKVDGVDLRLDYGVPLLDLGDPGDNLQDHGFYFNLNYHP